MSAILITGAARRIGRALALGLAERGYELYLHYHASAAEAAALVEQVRSMGRTCQSVSADLAKAEEAAALVSRCQSLGPVSHLINNAAIYSDDPDDFSAVHFDRQMAVNLRAPLIVAEAFSRQAPGGASIVNLLDSRVGALSARFVSYMTAKAGLEAATEMLALRYAPRVRVNAVAPGPILASAVETPDTIEAFQARTPLALALSPNDIVEATAYLVTARALTGQVLYVDGGNRFTSRTYV